MPRTWTNQAPQGSWLREGYVRSPAPSPLPGADAQRRAKGQTEDASKALELRKKRMKY